MQEPQPLLRLDGLTVGFSTDDGEVRAVRGVDLDVHAGEILAIVGESGSGKSVTALSVLRLHQENRTNLGGHIWFQDEDLLTAGPDRMRNVRGAEISMIFQDPLTALNPVYRVGKQIAEMILSHESVSRKAAMSRAVEMLGLVGIPQPERRALMYPHEFSGGMRQRAMIAMALACQPKMIIADEPTTALDVTVQAQVLDLLADRARDLGAAVILITHDLGVVAGMADRIAVMYAGLVAELGSVDGVFGDPSHPYTIGLLNSLPKLTDDGVGEFEAIGGPPPSMLNPPSGCGFHPRCPYAKAEAGCFDVVPPLVGTDHRAACHRSDEVKADFVSLRTGGRASDAPSVAGNTGGSDKSTGAAS